LAFGQELQWERVQRSVSLESIAEGTKVPQRHLMALELEQFDQLPGGIFAKGILRSYCRHLGLNEEDSECDAAGKLAGMG
jgi:cytoskeleton protein RodZ